MTTSVTSTGIKERLQEPVPAQGIGCSSMNILATVLLAGLLTGVDVLLIISGQKHFKN